MNVHKEALLSVLLIKTHFRLTLRTIALASVMVLQMSVWHVTQQSAARRQTLLFQNPTLLILFGCMIILKTKQRLTETKIRGLHIVATTIVKVCLNFLWNKLVAHSPNQVEDLLSNHQVS